MSSEIGRHSLQPASKSLFMRNTQDSPFLLDLPAELRNAVYREVLVATGQTLWLGIGVDLGFDFKETIRTKQLLNTCKQVRLECARIFWGENNLGISLGPYDCHQQMSELIRLLKTVASKDDMASIRRLILLDLYKTQRNDNHAEPLSWMQELKDRLAKIGVRPEVVQMCSW